MFETKRLTRDRLESGSVVDNFGYLLLTLFFFFYFGFGKCSANLFGVVLCFYDFVLFPVVFFIPPDFILSGHCWKYQKKTVGCFSHFFCFNFMQFF